MKKVYLLMVGLFLSSSSMAAAKVNYLNVEGNQVYFSTDEAKSVASPACAAVDTIDTP